MLFHPDRHHRRSIRLKGYDYSLPGVYFVTVCTQGRECVFGEVMNKKMRLNEIGRIVGEEWTRSASIRQEMELDAFVVMPNHLHGVVILRLAPVGAHGRAPLQNPPHRAPKSLGSFIAGFKPSATCRINIFRKSPGIPLWQRNYYERVVRDERELARARQYVRHNSMKWAEDENHPDRLA